MSLSITRHNKMFRFASFLFISSCISLVKSEISTNNYCDSKWCPFPYLQHTACGNSGVSWKIRFSPNICKNFYLSKTFNPLFCPSDIHFVKLSKALKQFILDSHNQYRMMVALGLQERYPVTNEWGFSKLLMNLNRFQGSNETFPSAGKMMRLVWNEEQAYMASLQLRTCLM